jgi:hypothetical protein
MLLWQNLRYCAAISLEALKKTEKHLSQNSRISGQDLNPRPPKHKQGRSVMWTEPNETYSRSNNHRIRNAVVCIGLHKTLLKHSKDTRDAPLRVYKEWPS